MLPRMHLWSVSQSVNWSDTSSKPLFLLVNLLLTSLACTLLPLLRLYQHVSFFSSLFHTHANFVGFRDFSIELSFFKLLCGILMTVDSFQTFRLENQIIIIVNNMKCIKITFLSMSFHALKKRNLSYVNNQTVLQSDLYGFKYVNPSDTYQFSVYTSTELHKKILNLLNQS